MLIACVLVCELSGILHTNSALISKFCMQWLYMISYRNECIFIDSLKHIVATLSVNSHLI